MIIKKLEGLNGKVTLKLTYQYKDKKQEIFLFESNSVDAKKNQKLVIDAWHCANHNEAMQKLQKMVEEYMAKGYTDTSLVNTTVEESTSKPSFLSKIFRIANFFKLFA